jgi:hypothetical protein
MSDHVSVSVSDLDLIAEFYRGGLTDGPVLRV